MLKIAIHLEQFMKPSGTPKEIPEGISGEDVAKGAFYTYTVWLQDQLLRMLPSLM